MKKLSEEKPRKKKWTKPTLGVIESIFKEESVLLGCFIPGQCQVPMDAPVTS